ncbi:DUF6083 domain-containing protein [Streptomyces phaeochromogenes]|uniref:DUF6083 domain-containing protein n=1 Tax=Streptomyces phaeochromogenes TaxID=1923 RepID=UPI002F91370C|nr:DUF6083 domain-containing protein [Streptomyces phaeochromogenes]
MCPNTASTGRHRDSSHRTTYSRRPLRVAAASPSRLLRAGQSSRCRQCGHRIDLYQRTDQRPIALHPAELANADVPPPCRWHLSSGIAHPHGDGSPWCRIPHAVLCPSRTATTRMSPHIEAMRRQLAVRTRRLIDTGAITQATPTPCKTPADNGRTDRAVVQLLLGRYLAEGPVEDIRCVAQTRQRRRCPHPVLDPRTPAGIWTLLPVGPQHGQLALPDALMAVYDLSRLPYTEQLRWRTQRCPAHAATPGAADLTLAGWQVFDLLLHAAHLDTRLPHPPPSRRREA